MTNRLLLATVTLAVALCAVRAPAQTLGSIERDDPAVNALVPTGAKIEKVAGGFKFTEGPIWIHSGYLLFADIPNDRIMKWTPDAGERLPGVVTLFLHPSGYLGKQPYTGPESGSNGMTLDSEGRVTVAGHAGRRVYRIEKNGDITTLTESYNGKRLNSPNDLVYAPDGSLYFTDPPYGLPTQSDHDPLKQLPFNGVYRLPGAHLVGGNPQLLIKNLTRPNGIAFSPDHKYLYVDNSEPRKLYMRYQVDAGGGLSHGKVFYDVTSATAPGLPDGMKVDVYGNIYATGPGGIWIFSPQGKHLGTIKPPEIPANCNWGGADGNTLYMTARTGLYRIRLNTAGVRP